MSGPVFDSHADAYETDCMRGLAVSGESKEFFARGRLTHLARVLAERGRPRPSRIVDFGCGVGDVSALLAETFPGASVLGVDPSARCVDRARQERSSSGVSFATLGEVPCEPADLVHLNGVLHHVAVSERPAFMQALRAWVGRGGVLALFENNPFNPGTRLVMSRISFDRDAVPISAPRTRALLRNAGFRVLETRYLFYFPRPLKALRPAERLLTRIPLGAQYAVLAVPEPA
jgi:SAM-dependent methyltransferase